jgi:hypothetical protein
MRTLYHGITVRLLSFILLSDFPLENDWYSLLIQYLSANLPGSFCVWAATKQAEFLHGRFVWANWDVEELAAMKEMADPGFLKMGLQSIDPVGPGYFADIMEMRKKE